MKTPAKMLSFVRTHPKTIWTVAALVVVAGAGAVVAGRAGSDKQDAAAGKAVAEAAPLEFSAADVYRVRVEPLARQITISGTLNPATQAVVKSTISGELRQVNVREGDTVSQGSVVAEVDTADARSRLDAARADQAERRARLTIAERNRDTNLTLLKQNFISQNAFDQLNSTQQASEAAVRWADAQVELASKAVEDARVRAPMSGTVAKRYVNPGERVLPDAPLLTIVDLSRMELEATVTSSDVAAVSTGQPVSFHVDGFGARAFTGRVQRINPVAEPGSRAIKVFVAVNNPGGVLRGGMFAEGAMALAGSVRKPAIPQSAVFEEAGQSYVFALDSGKVAKKNVRIGVRDELTGMVAVDSGLNEGQVVVRVRMPGLKEGALVMVPPAAQAPA